MTKKRFLIAIAIVMVLILSVAVFVACNENQTKSYTVKFVDGESEVKSVSVEEGKTIADADVPADLTKDGYVFEGWYVGDVAFDKSAAITADVTYSAKWTKLHTVKFVDGDETIKTATVKDGENSKMQTFLLTSRQQARRLKVGLTARRHLTKTQQSQQTKRLRQMGWSLQRNFQNGEETIKVAQVKDGAVIAAADIPEDPTDDNYAFIGWFVGETAYDSSAAVTSDIVVNANSATSTRPSSAPGRVARLTAARIRIYITFSLSAQTASRQILVTARLLTQATLCGTKIIKPMISTSRAIRFTPLVSIMAHIRLHPLIIRFTRICPSSKQAL